MGVARYDCGEEVFVRSCFERERTSEQGVKRKQKGKAQRTAQRRKKAREKEAAGAAGWGVLQGAGGFGSALRVR